MRFQILVFCTILIFSLFLTACPSNQTPNANSGNSAANTNKPANSGLTTNKTPVEATTNDAPTLKPVFKAYCDAMTKKDEAALRKVVSQDTLKAWETDMKSDNQKSLMKFLETEQVSNDICEVRNEKIEGDTGSAEVKTKGMPNGVRLYFAKENGEWKVTNKFPDYDTVKKSAENSNAAK